MHLFVAFTLTWIIMSTIRLGQCTFDLNIHQIQFVADHLSEKECNQLLKLLNERLQREKKIGKSDGKVGKGSCLDRLKAWNIRDGQSHTFYILAADLKRIGRPRLSSKLSKIVFGVKADAVKRTFLSDPFKAMIHTGSPLLEESSPAPRPEPEEVKEPKWRSSHTLSVISISMAVILNIVIVVQLIRSRRKRLISKKAVSEIDLPEPVTLITEEQQEELKRRMELLELSDSM